MSFQSGQFGLRGASEMADVLRKFPPFLRRRVLNGALRKAAKPVLWAAIANAPVGARATRKYWRLKGGGSGSNDYGHLRDNLRIVTVGRSRTMADATVLVSTGDAFWGRFVELGRRGAPMRMKPFLGPAFRDNVDQSLEILGTELAKGIEKGAENLAGPYLRSAWRR